MKQLLFLLLLCTTFITAKDKYMDNHSCKECHENIYEEYQSSAHSKSYFTDELHRGVADQVSTKKYDCAVCHMPMADNLNDLVVGKARPNKNNKTHTDGVSCFFCHTIAYVKKAHKHNINTKARQAKNYKPTLYGRLLNPDENDKHSSSKNPVYGKNVCMGCHSHKLNDHNATVFVAMDEKQNSLKCIECHMPELSGGAEKMDKRARGHHASHKFLGIHDKKFRATGMDINISNTNNSITITLKNKMAHPLIIQPSRAKYLVVQVLRDGKEVWRNYKNDPKEDKEVFFEYRFFDKDGKKIVIPAKAYRSEMTNLNTHKSKSVTYKNVQLQKGDTIKATMYVRFAKRDCQLAVKLKEKQNLEQYVLKEVSYSVKDIPKQ